MTTKLKMTKTTMQTSNMGVAPAIRAITASAGPIALYRGFSIAVAEHTVNRAILFGGSTLCKQHTPTSWPEPLRDAVGGVGAGLGKTALLHPLDTIKTRWQLGEPALPAKLLEAFAKGRLRRPTDPRGLKMQWEAICHFDARDRLALIDHPVLILHGEEDGLTPIRAAERLAEGLPNAVLVPLEGIGHSPQVEAIERFNAALSEFLHTRP